MSDSTPMKRCSKCKIEKPATPEFFVKNSACKDGLHTQCKDCKNARGKQSWEENKEKRNSRRRQKYWDDPKTRQRNLDYLRKWGDENRDKQLEIKRQAYWENREQNLQQSREWRLKNPEYRKTYDREYAKKNKAQLHKRKTEWANNNRERIRQQRRAAYTNNPHARRLEGLLRDARKRELPNTFTKDEYYRMLEYWGNACAISGEKELLQIDHWIPLNSPNCPGTVAGNMIPLSRSLNFSKQDTDPVTWLIWKFGEEEGLKHLAKIEAYFEWLKPL